MLKCFLTKYQFDIEETNMGNYYVIITRIIEKESGTIVNGIRTILDICEDERRKETNYQCFSLTKKNMDSIIDQIKSAQLDWLSRRTPILINAR